jgi:TPR repeat protein
MKRNTFNAVKTVIICSISAVLLSNLTGCQTAPPPKRYVPTTKNDIVAYNPSAYNYAYNNFKTRAERGDPIAQNNLGKMYADGRGMPQNAEKSVEWFTKAALQGDTDAELNLGVACLYGHGTAKDREQACHWFKAAKRSGNQFANEFYRENC